jgi:DNA-binding response OmpR family regulator
VSALERFFEKRPDCVMVDVRMPGLDGYQLVRMLRGDAQTSTIPLIILTALAKEQNRFIGLASGADQYLVKPVRPRALMEAIRNALKANQAERAERLSELAESELPQPDTDKD